MVGDRGMCHLSAMHKIWPLIVVDDQIMITNNSQMVLQVWVQGKSSNFLLGAKEKKANPIGHGGVAKF